MYTSTMHPKTTLIVIISCASFHNLVALNGEYSLADLPGLYFTTLHHGERCDMQFHEQYVAPIYIAETVEKVWQAKYTLHEHIVNNPAQAQSSCYGLVGDSVVGTLEEVLMECVPTCRDPLAVSGNSSCCRCINREPLVFERKPHRGCIIKESQISDPCDPLLAAQYKIKVQQVLHMELKDAKTRRNYVDALIKYAISIENFIQGPHEKRLLCTTDSKNLECSDEESKCQCINEPPYFKYEPDKDGRHCLGKEAAICNILGVTKDGSFEQVSRCVDGLNCEEAVPGLVCEDPLEDDCKFDVVVGTDEHGKNLTSKLLLWNVRACGGVWKDKEPLEKSAALGTLEMHAVTLLLTLALLFYFYY